ncbi:GntR family transcriptional regulator (plasmid) [Paroceanicella profunda]|uniref:GntR family transcriptional regulator n=1 Tax=Paroceanicella profunda TaxID=2579971 RepID=A0A5B8G3S1_9RHOB|nr:GntR family transcriptional regulator [Paroceanicella profunda]QDL94630.1 GntR family transcriptional regulator [Paroceanicella profunda]
MQVQLDRRLSEQAYDRIMERVLEGSLPAGTVIQERRLAAELGMSRTPLRDALLMLEGDGIVVREGPRLLRVMTMDITRYMETLAIRRLLEGEAARLSAGRVPPERLDGIEARLRTMLDAHRQGTPATRAEIRAVDEALHGTMSEVAGNRQLRAIVMNLRLQTQIFDLKNVPERFEDTCREHLAIVDALRGGDKAAAEAAVCRHLDAVRQCIIDRLIA